MVLTVFMLAQVTLGAIERLPPEQAGNLVLSGKTHGVVQSVVREPATGLDPPGSVRISLIEKAEAVPEGCQRLTWTAEFVQAPEAPVDEAALRSAFASREIALAPRKDCSSAAYARVDPRLESSTAFVALKALRSGVAERPQVKCSDETASDLCRDSATTWREVARLEPWSVSLQGGTTVVWLGVRGQVVTEVRVIGPGRFEVARRVPAPA